MSNFYYRIKDKSDTIKTGYIQAMSMSDAARQLEYRGYKILEITEEDASSKIKYTIGDTKSLTNETMFSLSEKREFFNAFYFQYKSGLSITQTFQTVMVSTPNKKIKSLCSYIIKKVQKGSSLKEALEKHSNALGAAYTMLVCAGEESGKLDEVLSAIIKNLQREEEIKRNLISSLTYPCLILCMTIAVFILFNSFIFKVFKSMGSDNGVDIMQLFIFAIIKIIFVFTVMCFCILFIMNNDKIKKIIINFISSFKLISKMLKYYYFQNFFTVLALAYESGVPAIEAITMAGTVIKIDNINLKLKKSVKMISEGCEITTALGVINIFSPYAMSQISAGERAGELEKMFKLIANDYEKQLELSIKVLSKVIEPVMLIIVGCMVASLAVNAYSQYYNGIFSLLT